MVLTNNTSRLRRCMWAISSATMLLLLGPVQPINAQTTGDQAKQMRDEQVGKMLAAADSYTVDAVNRHDAYAVAAVFWDDGIEVTPLGVFRAAPRSSSVWPSSTKQQTCETSLRRLTKSTYRETTAGLSPIGAPTTSRSPAANGVPSKATSPAFLRNVTVSGRRACTRPSRPGHNSSIDSPK